MSLDTLAQRYGTDKRIGVGLHGYTRHYEEWFRAFRNEVVSVLEIGVHNGGSVQMWRDYFPNAVIHGLDYALEVSDETLRALNQQERLCIHIGDQSDRGDLAALAACGSPFDIVIDDASHTPSNYLLSFERLWPDTRRLYVIEDVLDAYVGDSISAITASMASAYVVPSECEGRSMLVMWR